MHKLPLFSCLAFVALSACSSDSEPAAPAPGDAGSDVAADVVTPPGTIDGDPALDPAADPPPATLPVVAAFDGSGDVAPDLSCGGQPMPDGTTSPAERELHFAQLGGTDADRVEEIPFDVFLGNRVTGAPDASGTSSKGSSASDPTRGTASVSLGAEGFVATRTAAATGYLETFQLDLWVPKDGPVLVAATPESAIAATEVLIGGVGFTTAADRARVVVTVADCQRRPMSGVHVVLEVDGAVVPPVTSDVGLRRGYFGDTQLPDSALTHTSRSGIVGFLDVPAKSVRLVARGRKTADGPIEVLATRPLSPKAGAVTTALVSAFVEPL